MLVDLIETITAWAESVVQTFGASGIFLIAFLENMFPPTPSEFLYPLAGKLAFDGIITIPVVIVAGVAGSLVGSLLYYGLGYWLGEERVRTVIARYGTFKIGSRDFTVVSVATYDQALHLFEQRGTIIVLVAKVMPVVHGIVSIPAGVVQMNLLTFILYSAIGSTLWIAPLSLLGFWLGSQWERLLTWIQVYENLWYALIAIGIGYLILRRYRKRNQE